MHGDMKGFYEVRGTGPKRRQYRLFCLLDHRGRLPEGPALVLITGMSKPHLTEFSARDYARVRRLGEDYRSRPSARYQVSDS